MNSVDTLKELASCKPGLATHKFQAVLSWLPVCLTESFFSLASVSIFLEQWCYTVTHPIQIHPEIITYTIPKT